MNNCAVCPRGGFSRLILFGLVLVVGLAVGALFPGGHRISPRAVQASTGPVDAAVGVALGSGYDDGYVEGPYTYSLMPVFVASTRNDEARLGFTALYRGRFAGYGGKVLGASEHRAAGTLSYRLDRTRSFSSSFSLLATDSGVIPDLGEGALPAGPRRVLALNTGPVLQLDPRTTVTAQYALRYRYANRPTALESYSHGLVIAGERAHNRLGTLLGSTAHRVFILPGGGYAMANDLAFGFRYTLDRDLVSEVIGGPLLLLSLGDRLDLSGLQSEDAWLSWGALGRLVHTRRDFAAGVFVERAVEPHPITAQVLWSESVAGWVAREQWGWLQVRLTAGGFRSGIAPGTRTEYLGGWGTLEAAVPISDHVSAGLDLSHYLQHAYDEPAAEGMLINRNIVLLKLSTGLPSLEAVHER